MAESIRARGVELQSLVDSFCRSLNHLRVVTSLRVFAALDSKQFEVRIDRRVNVAKETAAEEKTKAPGKNG